MTGPVDLTAVLSRIDQPWQPQTVALLNDYDLRVVRPTASSPATATPRPTRCSSSSPAR